MKSLLLTVALAICVLCCAATVRADTLTVTSTPSGASVEIDGVVVGKTPFEMKVPSSYVKKPHTIFTARLEHTMMLRVSLPGYLSKEIEMTEAPMHFVTMNGVDHGQFWLLKTTKFDVALEPINRAAMTGTVKVSLASNAAIELKPDLPTEQIVRRTEPAVLLIETPRAIGSGFFVTDTGVVVTNEHVVHGESSVMAIFSDGSRREAKVEYADDGRDLALLKIEGTGFPFLKLGATSAVQQGQTAIAIGNPGQGMPFTVTKGIVSGVGANPLGGPGTWIQTDAAINHGNSGGPLLNGQAEVIGINAQRAPKADVQNVGFAISTNDLVELLSRFYPAVSLTGPQPAGQDGFGTANLSSDPDGADVYVDGKFVGNTPERLKLTAGSHVVRMSQGQKTWERTIEILRDSDITLRGQLAMLTP